jgi:MinD superfamily P-loop ATPase/SAM-dependent methyltransferase
MKEIVVLSGKGGVGKSTITASLGVVLSKEYKEVMADTDVDAPNLALFFRSVQRQSKDIRASEKAAIDYEKCASCLECVEVCRFSSMVEFDASPLVIPYTCEGCGACAIVCPEGAIEIKDTVNGRIVVSDCDGIIVVSGELSMGGSSSGRLVDEVKRASKEEAARVKAELTLTDGPPGIGCPVISSVKGCDYLVAATEPTPAALSDLKRLLDVVAHFRVPCGVVINKSDIHQASRDEIRDFARQNDIEILAEIPYDISVPRAVAEARPVVEAYPEASSSMAIRTLVGRVKRILSDSGSASVFDAMAERYDAWYDSEEGRPLYESELKCITPLVGDGRPILEIGVGTGRFAMHFPGAVGIDPAPNVLSIAEERGVKTVKACGESLPFEKETFGCALLIVTLCFVENPLEVLREARRILRKGGSLVVGLVPRDSLWGAYYEEKRKEGHPFYEKARFYAFEDLQDMLRRAGFEILEVKSTLLQRPHEPRRVEEPVDGYVRGAGFLCIRAGKTNEH